MAIMVYIYVYMVLHCSRTISWFLWYQRIMSLGVVETGHHWPPWSLCMAISGVEVMFCRCCRHLPARQNKQTGKGWSFVQDATIHYSLIHHNISALTDIDCIVAAVWCFFNPGKDPDDGSPDDFPKTPKTSRSSRSPNNRINLPKEFPRLSCSKNKQRNSSPGSTK